MNKFYITKKNRLLCTLNKINFMLFSIKKVIRLSLQVFFVFFYFETFLPSSFCSNSYCFNFEKFFCKKVFRWVVIDFHLVYNGVNSFLEYQFYVSVVFKKRFESFIQPYFCFCKLICTQIGKMALQKLFLSIMSSH